MYYQYERKATQKDTNIVIVNISIIPRQDIGKLINKISKLKPKVIAVDVFFGVENDTLNPIGTDTLVQQIKDINNLVLVSAYRGQDRFGRDSIETQSPRIRKYVKEGIANFNIPKDDPEYGTLRSFSPYVNINGENHLSFSFLVASYYDSTLKKYASNDDMFIKWYGYAYNENFRFEDRGVFESFEWSEVMDSSIDRKHFKDKIVLLGFMGEKIGYPSTEQLFYSPMNYKIIGRSTPDIYGVEMHANAIKMVIDKDFVKQSWAIDYSYSLLIMVLFILFLNWLKSRYDKYYPILSKILLILIINIFVFGVVGIFYETNGSLKILIGEALIVLLIIPDILEFLTDNVFKRIKLS
jgi:CHASE2 domain-containing sensor protein